MTTWIVEKTACIGAILLGASASIARRISTASARSWRSSARKSSSESLPVR